FRALRRSPIFPRRAQHRGLRRPCGQCADVPRPAAVRLLRAPAPLDQSAAGPLPPALDAPGSAGFPVLPLDAGGGSPGADRSAAPGVVRHRGSRLADAGLARARLGYRRRYLEMDATLDADLSRRPP